MITQRRWIHVPDRVRLSSRKMHDKITMVHSSWLDGMISRRPPPSKTRVTRRASRLMGAHKAKMGSETHGARPRLWSFRRCLHWIVKRLFSENCQG